MRRIATHREYELAERLNSGLGTHVTRAELLVDYRESMLEVFEALELRWRIEDSHLDREFGVRRSSILYSLDLREAIDTVRGNVSGRGVRSAQKETDHEQGSWYREASTHRPQKRRWWQWWW